MPARKIISDLKVLLLCGGKGERLNPLTKKIPKPLIPINGTPILTHLISYLELHGFRKFIIAAGYKSEKIFEYFDHHHRNLDIEITDSGDVDIIKRIQHAARLISGDFIMCYGDTLADINMTKLIQFHRRHSAGITITSYPLQSPFGILEMDRSGRIQTFVEKPILDKWINIGYFYFSKECLTHIRKGRSFVRFLKDQAGRGEMFSYRHRGIHITVNTITELREAEKNIKKINTLLNR